MSAGYPAELTASALNRLGQYVRSSGYRAYCHAELAVSSLVVARRPSPILIPRIHRGMARLSWPGIEPRHSQPSKTLQTAKNDTCTLHLSPIKGGSKMRHCWLTNKAASLSKTSLLDQRSEINNASCIALSELLSHVNQLSVLTPTVNYMQYLSTTFTAVRSFHLPAPQFRTLSWISSWTRPSVQIVSDVCLKRICSRILVQWAH